MPNSLNDSIDPQYEFAAPKFQDFTNLSVDQDADQWFELQEGASMHPLSPDAFEESSRRTSDFQLTCPVSPKFRTAMRASARASMNETNSSDDNKLENFEAFQETEARPRRASEVKRLTQPVSPKFRTAMRASARASMNETSNSRASDTFGAFRDSEPNRRTSELTCPVSPKFRTAARASTRASIHTGATAGSKWRGGGGGGGEDSEFAAFKAEAPVARRASDFHLTCPVSPKFRTASRASIRASKPPLSSDEQEEQELQEFREKSKKRRRENEESMLSALAPNPVASTIIRSTKPLTEPVDLFFHSEARARSSESSMVAAAAAAAAAAPRKRQRTYQTKEERDLEEMGKQFKAHPVNRRVLESAGQLGVPRIKKQKLTEPVNLFFHTEKRAVERAEFDAYVKERQRRHNYNLRSRGKMSVVQKYNLRAIEKKGHQYRLGGLRGSSSQLLQENVMTQNQPVPIQADQGKGFRLPTSYMTRIKV